jgi:serine/threonine protein kinase
MTPEAWQAISPYLDQALEMPEDERALWLATLRKRDPDLFARLEALLKEHRVLVEEHFLERAPSSPPVPNVLAGQTIGPYRLVSLIGEGGMGSVWLAERRDGRFERRTAVKFLRAPLGGGAAERFKREGLILARLAHTHIAQLLDAGISASGLPYLVLEYVEGEDIVAYCDGRRLEVETRLRLFLDVLAAVTHAHSNLIVHRDLKPSNVLVTWDGQVKLLDFGIAKLLEGEDAAAAATLLTREGGGALTPQYAAPEQVTGSPVTTATDVYAAGVLLYVLLTGQHPAGPGPHSTADLVKAVVEIEPPRPSDVVAPPKNPTEQIAANAVHRATTPDKLRRLLRGDLDTIVAKALKKKPQERYASAAALADDLRHYLNQEPIGARPDTLTYLTLKFIRRNRTTVALAALAFVALVIGMVGTLIQSRTARKERDFALRQLNRSQALDEFHSFLLSDAAPAGKPFTVNELLDRAEGVLARQRATNDPNKAVLQADVGMQYLIQEQNAKATRILEQAHTLSQGVSDPSVRATAACYLALAVARNDDLPRAESLVQEGLRELPDAPQFALARVGCLRSASEVAQERGETREGVTRMEEARRVLAQSPFQSDWAEMLTLMDLGEAYRTAGENNKAILVFEKVNALASSLGRDETQTAGVLCNDWALSFQRVGRPLEAEKLFRRAIDIDRAGETEETVPPVVLNNYAKTLRELGRLDEAADYAERAYKKAERVQNQFAIYQSLYVRALIYIDQHDYRRAGKMLAEVEPILRHNFPPQSEWIAALESAQGLLALGKGNSQQALQFADQGVAAIEGAIKARGEGADYLPLVLLRRAAIEQKSALPDRAAADASRTLELLQAHNQPASYSCYVGDAYLALGRALQAEGKHDEALQAFRSAAKHLAKTLGPDHPDTRAARQLAGLEPLTP